MCTNPIWEEVSLGGHPTPLQFLPQGSLTSCEEGGMVCFFNL